MLCTLLAEGFDGDDWLFEPKYDGLRVLCHVTAGRTRKKVEIWSRNDKRQETLFPEIAAGLAESLGHTVILDGEIVCLDSAGQSSFRALQQRFHLQDPAERRRRMAEHPAFLYLFDILYLDEYDLRDLPLDERKQILHSTVRWNQRIRETPGVVGRGVEALRGACAAGQEGIIGKRRDSRYVAGRSDAWVKIKCIARQEFVIGGFTDPQRSRVGLGALLVGYYDDSGRKLVYAGKVGTGYTTEVLRDLRQRLDVLRQKTNPFAAGEPPWGGWVHWVEPRLVAEIAFAEWTQHGLLRQPRFEGLREDKHPRSVHRERPKTAVADAPPPLEPAARKLEAAGQSRVSESPGLRRHTMALEEYKKKRDFSHTPEPAPRVARPASADTGIFVIQEHHASHLHWDFRLEVDGVLKSWALPKEPPAAPGRKNLAVQVEDHPLAYADFHGDIPEGQYGAGHVEIWDRGTYQNLHAAKASPRTMAEALENGKVEIELHGQRLHGTYALIRTRLGRGKVNWLLFKTKEQTKYGAAASETPVRRRAAREPGGLRESPATKSPRRAASAEKGWSRPQQPARKPAPRRVAPRSTATARVTGSAPAKPLLWTHPEKIMFPEVGITKGQVLDFYARIAEWLLPHLHDRPMTLERLPEGLRTSDSPHFWQKHTPAYYPAWIPRVNLPAEERSGRAREVDYVLVNDLQTLLYLVNQGCLTFHPWLSRVEDLDRPDYVLFDLDPGTSSFAAVIQTAFALHKILRQHDVEAFVKTSGKSGLHVLTPWENAGSYDEARTWAAEIAAQLIRDQPEIATTHRLKSSRASRVYVDIQQNARGHHAVPPYVLRATPEATISTPLLWSEVKPGLDPRRFTLQTIFQRLRRLRSDPLAPLTRVLSAR